MYFLFRFIRLIVLISIFIVLMWKTIPNHGSAIVLGWAGGIGSEILFNKRYPLKDIRKNRKKGGLK